MLLGGLGMTSNEHGIDTDTEDEVIAHDSEGQACDAKHMSVKVVRRKAVWTLLQEPEPERTKRGHKDDKDEHNTDGKQADVVAGARLNFVNGCSHSHFHPILVLAFRYWITRQ